MAAAREAEIQRLVVRLMGNIDHYVSQMNKASSVAGAKMKEIGKKATAAGRTLSTKLTLPLLAVGGASVKAFSDFDKAMIESTSIMKVTGEQINQMREQALKLSSSGELRQGPKELAESYFFLASAGKSAEQSMKLLPVVSTFATAGAFDMALATDLLTDAQSALGLSVEDVNEDMKNMVRLSDVLVKANTLANATVQQFSESLTNDAGAALKTLNKDVEEGVAVLAAYADQGVKGQVAGSQLGRVIRLLNKSALENAEAHKELNFQVFDGNGKMRNMADIVKNLEQVTDGMSDETRAATLSMLGFEARVQQAILPLIGMSDKIADYERKLRQAGGTTQNVAENQMQSFSARMGVLKNRITAVAIEAGQKLAPILEKMGEKLVKLIEWWSKLDAETQENIITIAAVAAALGPLLIVIGQVSTGLGVLTTAFKTVTASAALSKTAFVGLAVTGIALLATKIRDANPHVQKLNSLLQESVQLSNKLGERDVKKSTEVLERISGLSGKEKIAEIERQLAVAQNNIEGREFSIQTSESMIAELNRGPLSNILGWDPAANLFNKYRIEEEEATIREAVQRNESEKELRDALLKQLAEEKRKMKEQADKEEKDKALKQFEDMNRSLEEINLKTGASGGLQFIQEPVG